MAMFTTAEARAFDKAQLASATDYPDLTITTKEAELREWFCQIFGVDFIPTSHTDTLDGDGSDFLLLRWPLITEVTAISIDGVAVDAAYLNPTDYGSGLAIDAYKGIITSRGLTFTAGWSNVEVTYTAGHATVPARIKRAALQMALAELVPSNMPVEADGYDIGATSVNFGRADGWRENWFQSPDGQAAFRAYSMKMPGIA